MKKRIISIILAVAIVGTMLPTTAFAANTVSFRDVAPTAWYYDAVGYVSRKGIMSGVGNGSFSPETTLTRAQLCQILYNMEGKPRTGNGAFSDVSADAWYKDAVSWSAEHSIVNGMGNGIFNPNLPITREQVVTILYRFAAYKNYNLSVPVSLDDYSDAGRLSSWAEDAMCWAVSEGIISGTSATTIAPQGTATRAQAATMLMRFCERMEAKEKFYAKDVEDFRGAEVINFDDSNETNFAVLVEDAVTSESSAEVNQLVSADEESGVYKFSHIDQTISALKPGDVLYFTYGGGADDYLLLKVGAIEINGDVATVTEGKAELSDYFQYIDVDMALDLSAADLSMDNTMSHHENVTIPSYFAVASNIQPQNALNEAEISRPTKFAKDISGSISNNLKLTLDEEPLSCTFDVKLTLEIKICYTAESIFNVDINEISLSVKQESKFEGRIYQKLKGEFKSETKPAYIPVTPQVSVGIQVYGVVGFETSAGGAVAGTFETESGSKYCNGNVEPIKESKADIEIGLEGNFKGKLGIGVTGSVTLLKVITLELGGETGIELRGEAETAISVNTNIDVKHLCLACTDGRLNAYFELSFGAKVGMADLFSWKLVDWKLAKVTVELKRFYISIAGGTKDIEFGWGECPHKQYLMTVIATDQFGNKLPNVSVEVADAKTGSMPLPTGKTGEDGTYRAYYDNKEYKVTGFGLDGYQKGDQTVTVNNRAVTVNLVLEKDSIGLKSDIVVDMFTGMPQIRYYDDNGQIIYCITLDSSWDYQSYQDGNYTISRQTGYLHEAYVTAFFYDSVGKLTRSSGVNEKYDYYAAGEYIPRSVFYGDLNYSYEGDLIKAYDRNGKFRFAMDKNWNITTYSLQDEWDNSFDAKYTYNKRGQVTAIEFDYPMDYGEAKITYDVDGNVTTYNRIEHYIQDNGWIGEITEEWNRKYTYENGQMVRFDDSDGSFSIMQMRPWQFVYDANGKLSELHIKDPNYGFYDLEYDFSGNPHNHYSTWDYKFGEKQENGKQVPSIQVSIDGDKHIEKVLTAPSK